MLKDLSNDFVNKYLPLNANFVKALNSFDFNRSEN